MSLLVFSQSAAARRWLGIASAASDCLTIQNPSRFISTYLCNRALVPGLLEGVYEEALAYEFDLRKISYERQKQISLKYKGKEIGIHRIDFLVENSVILELKAVEGLNRIFEAQLLTYLNATEKKVGLLINFNVLRLKDGLKRLVV